MWIFEEQWLRRKYDTIAELLKNAQEEEAWNIKGSPGEYTRVQNHSFGIYYIPV